MVRALPRHVRWPAGGRTCVPASPQEFCRPRSSAATYGADGAPLLDAPQPQPASNDVRYTYTYDVPWDWAHRYPPNVTPSERPYVPGCGNETVTVPGRGGREQTINVTRCY